MDILQVKSGKIVDSTGQPVALRGTCVGGWMNMENFINGYPGSENGQRAAMAEVLGASKAQFFFDRLLDHFLAEDDIAFMKACGATVVRLPLNYRHFESDAAPFKYLESGFARLDRMVEACARHGLYVILDLHAVQGWQNTDWHCDNASRHCLFWTHAQFQDRYVGLWEALADHYKGNAAIAGYNVMNEPVTNAPRGRFSNHYTPDWAILNAVYRRVVAAIRALDPDHLIFLEGDYFSSRFAGMEAPFAANLVYSSHNYSAAGFGPGAYPGLYGGELWDRAKQEAVFLAHEGTRYAQQHGVPLWVGEFGAVYNGPAAEIPDRLRALDDQISVFNQHQAHWTTWTYKDVGVMGWITLASESEYMQRIAHTLKVKRQLAADFWMGWLAPTAANAIVNALARHIEETLADPAIERAANDTYLKQATLSGYVSELLQPTYAKAFQGLSEAQLDDVLQAFAFRNCAQNAGLVGIVKKYM